MVRDEARRVLPSGGKEEGMSMEEAGGYVIDVLTLAACAVVIVAALCAVMNESPLRRWRKLHTPPCRLCANHSEMSDSNFARARWDVCRCPRARERAERLEGSRADWLRCAEVRGTRVCVFEKKEEE